MEQGGEAQFVGGAGRTNAAEDEFGALGDTSTLADPAVVDDEVAFVGGYNIGSAYATEWRDTHVRITGPGVWDLKRSFADFWNLHRREQHGPPLQVDAPPTWESRIRVHRNIPRLWMFPIRSMYLEAINRATRNIYLTQAYFIPDESILRALIRASRRGALGSPNTRRGSRQRFTPRRASSSPSSNTATTSIRTSWAATRM